MGQPRKPEEPAAQASAGPGVVGTSESAQEGSPYGDKDMAQCPICQFIEAGPCKEPHQAWVQCRGEAKAAGQDYVEICQDKFKSFLQCTFDNVDYYEPFLEMLGGLDDPDAPQQAGDQAGPESPSTPSPTSAAASSK